MRYTQKRFSVSMAGEKATWPKETTKGCEKCFKNKDSKLTYVPNAKWQWLCEACKREYENV